jgi:hypothetical protein
MMGRPSGQGNLFYQFRLDERVPKDHLLRRIEDFVTTALAPPTSKARSPLSQGSALTKIASAT